MIIILTIIASLWINTLIHEVAHYFAAKMLGVIVSHVEIGKGKLLFKFVLMHDNWRFRLDPRSGHVTIFLSSKQWKNITVAAAGPTGSFIAAAIWLTANQPIPGFLALMDGFYNLTSFKGSDGSKIAKYWHRRNTMHPKYLHTN